MPSLVEKTPDDILSRIFLLIVQDEVRRTLDERAERERPRYPWTLASICTHWRKVCLEYQLLWSYINFSWHKCGLEGWTHEDNPSLKQVQLQLSRSGKVPLAIKAGIVIFCGCSEQRPIWKAVLAHSGRWVELDFGYGQGEEVDFARLVEEGQNTGFASLRHVTFNTGDPESDAYPLPLPGYNTKLTSLRSFTSKYVSALDEMAGFPWKQLTHLDLKPYTGFFTDLLKTLPKCKNLTHLSISLDEEFYSTEVDEISEEVEQESVVLPGLLELSLGNDDDFAPSFVKNILPFLTLPSLRYLKVYPVGANAQNCNFLLDFLQRSTTITELKVNLTGEEAVDGPGEEEDDDSDDDEATEARFADYVSKLFHNVPQLQILTFDGPLDTLISTLLEKQSNTSYLCPSLQQLTVNFGLPGYPESEELLVEMIKDRCGMKDGVLLKALHIIYPDLGSVLGWKEKYGDASEVALESAKARLKEALKRYTDNGLGLYFVPSQ